MTARSRADGDAEAEKQVTDPKEIAREVEAIEEEYDAIKSNQDLNQTRRRRELARRLGSLPHENSVKILMQVIENDSDLRARIEAMHAVAKVGDIRNLKRVFSIVKKEGKKNKPVLAGYLGSSFALARDGEVPAWLVDKVLKAGYRSRILRSNERMFRMAAIQALGALAAPEGRAPLLELLPKGSTSPTTSISTTRPFARSAASAARA